MKTVPRPQLASLLFLLAFLCSCKGAHDGKLLSSTGVRDGRVHDDVGEGSVASQSDVKAWGKEAVDACSAAIRLPSQEVKLADSSNYGNRETRDYLGRRIAAIPRFVVIHETVMGEGETIELFKTNHSDDADQVSYHILIARDGRVIRVVPDDKRAYGAGMSHFLGSTLRAKKNSVGSINNVALHISLVSPAGSESSDSHVGYTLPQYSSLARQVLKWQLQYGIPMSRVTTHYAVDRSHSRYDPRSFHWDKFDQIHGPLASKCKAALFAQPA